MCVLQHNTNIRSLVFLESDAFPFLLWVVAKSVCVMACPCGSVLVVGVETLAERLSCSSIGKKVAGLRPRHSHAKLGLINARDPAQCKNGMRIKLSAWPVLPPPPSSNQAFLRTAVVTLTTADLIERGGQSDR